MVKKLTGVVVITPQNVEQIENQLVNNKPYWVKWNPDYEWEVCFWFKEIRQFGLDMRLEYAYAIDLTPIVHREPIKLDLETIKTDFMDNLRRRFKLFSDPYKQVDNKALTDYISQYIFSNLNDRIPYKEPVSDEAEDILQQVHNQYRKHKNRSVVYTHPEVLEAMEIYKNTPLKPISDEEIEKMADEKYGLRPLLFLASEYSGYVLGAKDLRKKIYGE